MKQETASAVSNSKKGDEMKEHKYTAEIICPKCLKAEEASWEVSQNMDDGETTEHTCNSCGYEMTVEVNRDITYSSRPK